MAVASQPTPQQVLDNFDALATLRSVQVPGFAYGNGGGDFNLPHAGIPVYLIISFAGNLALSADWAGSASPGWPWNVLGLSTLIDYAGNVRFYGNGRDLRDLELVKGPGVFPDVPYGSMSYASDVYLATLPAAGANADINFSMVLPVSMGKNTALGSYIATVPNGQAQLKLKEASPVAGANVSYPLVKTAGTATLTGDWTMTYYYLDAPAQVPVPVDALQQIHEIVHQESTANLQAGAQNDTVLMTGRDYYRIIQTVYENDTESALNIAQIRFLVDGATPAMDETLQAYLARIRYLYLRDMPPGMLLYDFSDKPWTPNDYGSLTCRLNVGSGFTPGSYSNVVTLRECLYAPSGNLVAIGG